MGEDCARLVMEGAGVTINLGTLINHNSKLITERNAAPVAHINGGDRTITLPVTAIYLNGSESSDDLAVVKYVWTREDISLAAGTIIGNTDKETVMIVS